jgi:hypothetical protein
MTSLSATYHFLTALRRAAGRVFLTFVISLVVFGGGYELVHYIITGKSPTVFTDVLAAVLGVGWAIALSLVVLVGEIIRGLVAGVKDTVKDVEKEVGDVGRFAEGVAGTIEHHDKK